MNALLNHSGSFSVASPTPTDSARGRRGRLPPPISTATSLLERNSISSLPYSPPHSPGYIPTITPSYAPTFTPATTPTATLTPTSLTRDSWRNLSIILESSESSTSLLSTSTSVRVPVQPFENVNPSTVSTIPTAKDTSSILTEPSRQRYGFGLGSPAVDRPRSLSSDMFVGSGSPSVAERVAHFERVSRGNSPSNGLGSSQGLNAPRDTSRRHSSPFPLSGADGHEVLFSILICIISHESLVFSLLFKPVHFGTSTSTSLILLAGLEPMHHSFEPICNLHGLQLTVERG